MEDIRLHGRILTDSSQHITKEAIKNSGLFPPNSIIISTTATIGEHALIKVESLSNQQFTCLTIKENYKEKLLPDFYFIIVLYYQSGVKIM